MTVGVIIAAGIALYFIIDRWCEMRENIAHGGKELHERIELLSAQLTELETHTDDIDASAQSNFFEHGKRLDELQSTLHSLRLEVNNRFKKEHA